MTNEKTVTEREAVMRERTAWLNGIAAMIAHGSTGHGPRCIGCELEAKDRYPLPKITRTRVAKDNDGYAWKVEGSLIYSCYPGDNAWVEAWKGLTCSAGWTPARIALLADLIANPIETVEP